MPAASVVRQALLVLPDAIGDARPELEGRRIAGRSLPARWIEVLLPAGIERMAAVRPDGTPVALDLLPAEAIEPSEPALVLPADGLLDAPTVAAFVARAGDRPDRPHAGYVPAGGEEPATLAYLPPDLPEPDRRALLSDVAAREDDGWRNRALEVPLPGATRPRLGAPCPEGAAELALASLAQGGSLLSRFLLGPPIARLAARLARARVPARPLAGLGGALAAAAAVVIALPSPRLAWAGLLLAAGALLSRTAEAIACVRGDGRGARLAPLLATAGSWSVFVCLGVAAYRASGASAYLWGSGLLAATGAYYLTALARFLQRAAGPAPAALRSALARQDDLPRRVLRAAARVADGDLVALAVAAACAAGLVQPAATAVLVGAAWALFLTPAIGAGAGRARGFLLYVSGIGLLTFLVSRMPLDAIAESLARVGASALWVFGLALSIYVTLAFALGHLTYKRVPFGSMLYVILVGNAYNQILPLAGLGGEPYKVKLLSERMSLDRASQAIVLDRMLHTVPGPFIAGLLLPLGAWMVPMSGAVTASVTLTSALLLGGSCLLLVVSLSRVPTRLTTAVLRRFSALEAIRRDEIPRRRMAAAFTWKVAGQLLHVAEVWLIFRVLGYEGSLEQVVVVSAAVFASSAIFFIMPQGLGVNEAGITGAFALLGLPPHLGMTFGLIRRARLVLWALLGLALQLAAAFLRRMAADRPARAVAASDEPTTAESTL